MMNVLLLTFTFNFNLRHYRTLTQTYRFRPFINTNGADVFSFGLRGVGDFNFTAQAVPKTVDITIAPMNDAPEIRDVYSVHIGYYVYRDNESAWVGG